MSNHTQTPWDFKTDRLTGDCGFIAEGTGVFAECFSDIRRGGENAREECLANAELIKAAVNSYADKNAITAATIRNIFGVMNSIDDGDIDHAILPYLDWKRFADNPMRVFPKLADAQQDAIAEVINKRLSKLTEIAVKIGERND